LLILDSHNSHTSLEFIASCYLNNIFLCFLPAYTSHSLQLLDNSIFAVLKAAYQKELQKLQDLTDSAPVNKINFLQYLITARAAITPKVVKGGWRHSGNYPINRYKALSHEEIQ
ncbi:hypothetical protein M406DRAFT_234140, partial [Cryphonectria parasitica EP155]